MARRINERNTEAVESGRLPPLIIQIANQLEEKIIAGHFLEGEWLREQEIADRLGTSRGPVREALRLVEQEGFVEFVPWRGTRVVAMSRAELDDLLEVVAALQGLVSRLAAVHANDKELDEIEAIVDTMEATLTTPNSMGDQLRLAFEAGIHLRKGCGSKRAGAMLMKVGRLAYWQHRYLLKADKRWRVAAVRKWRKLVSALRDADGDRADKAARDMVHHSKTYIMRKRLDDVSLPMPQELPELVGRDNGWTAS